MSNLTTALENINKKDDTCQYTISREDMIRIHRNFYEKLNAKSKEELIKDIMGEKSYEDATIWYNYYKLSNND